MGSDSDRKERSGNKQEGQVRDFLVLWVTVGNLSMREGAELARTRLWRSDG